MCYHAARRMLRMAEKTDTLSPAAAGGIGAGVGAGVVMSRAAEPGLGFWGALIAGIVAAMVVALVAAKLLERFFGSKDDELKSGGSQR